jgi:glucose/arabinose dehydrogenase
MLRKFIIPLVLLISSLHGYGRLAVEKVAAGFERPVWAGMPPGSHGKLWVMEQAGTVWIVDLANGKRADEPFLDIRKDVTREDNEEGLLGLAFAPDFATSGHYYVNFTDNAHHTCIVRFTSQNRTTTAPASAETLLRFKQPFPNHNGGWIGFGPDAMLYIANGDGGSGNDPNQRGQALDNLLGKILRIDVSRGAGYRIPEDNPFVNREEAMPEIWAYGVRNPWRCSFDRKSGDFWMADVGQDAWEEINFMPRGQGAGANYGWRLREGLLKTPAQGVGGKSPLGAIDPVYVYKHGGGPKEGNSVTGGYVYRGPIKELQGRYLFADYQNPRIWSFRMKRGKADDFKDHSAELQPKGGRIMLICSFAEDNAGNLFIVDLSGPIYQIVGR